MCVCSQKRSIALTQFAMADFKNDRAFQQSSVLSIAALLGKCFVLLL